MNRQQRHCSSPCRIYLMKIHNEFDYIINYLFCEEKMCKNREKRG